MKKRGVYFPSLLVALILCVSSFPLCLILLCVSILLSDRFFASQPLCLPLSLSFHRSVSLSKCRSACLRLSAALPLCLSSARRGCLSSRALFLSCSLHLLLCCSSALLLCCSLVRFLRGSFATLPSAPELFCSLALLVARPLSLRLASSPAR